MICWELFPFLPNKSRFILSFFSKSSFVSKILCTFAYNYGTGYHWRQIIWIWTVLISFVPLSAAIQNDKRVTRSDSLFKTGVVSIKSCSHAETYRIVKTNVLTLQRYKLFRYLPNKSRFILSFFSNSSLVSVKITIFALKYRLYELLLQLTNILARYLSVCIAMTPLMGRAGI